MLAAACEGTGMMLAAKHSPSPLQLMPVPVRVTREGGFLTSPFKFLRGKRARGPGPGGISNPRF